MSKNISLRHWKK